MTPQVEDTLKSLPLRPGVYRMIGGEDVVLYVGKAKNLKSRVSSYFVKNDHSARIAMMVSQVERIDTTVTRSESEALLLENNLIKTLEPKYNVVFRDDKSYPYLCISGDAYPQLRFFRGKTGQTAPIFRPVPERVERARRYSDAAKGVSVASVRKHRVRASFAALHARANRTLHGTVRQTNF